MPLVSVVIPAYNAEHTILETIQSVQQQTFQDFEIIVINDGSKDKTLEKLQAIQDNRLKIVSQNNAGVCAARNSGINHAVGEFITFLDADDLWMPDKLEMQLSALNDCPKAGVAYSWTYYMYEKEGVLSFHPCPSISFSGNIYERLLIGDFILSCSNVLVRKQAIESTGGFDPDCPGCADWNYWVRLSKNWDFIVVPKYQILYRQSSSAMSSNVEKMHKEALIAIEKAYKSAPLELQYLKKYTLTNLNRYCADLYLNRRTDSHSSREAGKHICKAIQARPEIFFELATQRTLIKFLLKQTLPTSLANRVLRVLSKTRTVSDPRHKYEDMLNATQ
jgi:glycosyltransferase involved in cell wall biosynthesis